jgi:hypothetical protein
VLYARLIAVDLNAFLHALGDKLQFVIHSPLPECV